MSLTEQQQAEFLILFKNATGLELHRPPANRLDDPGVWIDSVAAVIGPAWAARLKNYRQGASRGHIQ
jgi:hypothetical protein